jgi:predicted MFS family arabinose efflux permease
MTRKEIFLLLTLASVNFINIMDFMIIMPLQEFLEKTFAISPAQFGLVVSSYAFSAFAASMTASFFVDRFDRKAVLLTAFAGLLLGTVGCGLATSYATLLASRIVAGLFGGLIAAQGLSIVGDLFSYEKRGRAMGLLMSGFAAATIAGVPLGLFLANRAGWQWPFLCIGLAGLAVFALAWRAIPSMRSHIARKGAPGAFAVYNSVRADRNKRYALGMMLMLIFSHFATIPFIAPYLSKNAGFSQEELPLMYFFGGASSLITSPLFGKLSDRFGKRRMFGLFLVLSAVPVFLLTNLGRVPGYQVILVTTLFFIVAGGRMVPANAIITSVVPPEMRGGFMNLNASLQQLGLGLASLTGGLVLTVNAAGELHNYDVIGYISIAGSLLCLWLMTRVRITQRAAAVPSENPG